MGMQVDEDVRQKHPRLVVMETPHPYRQKVLESGLIVREFRGDSDPEELVWHQDRQDRVIRVNKGTGWRLQLENGLPFPLREGNSYRIPARSWHRVIRGVGPLVITIQERKGENMAIKLTESRLRQIIREEAGRLSEMGRHGTSWGYGNYGSGGDYPRGGSDEYERRSGPEEVSLFQDEYPSFDMDLMDTNGQGERAGLVMQYLRMMNDRNHYGYSEERMKRAVPSILAAYGSY